MFSSNDEKCRFGHKKNSKNNLTTKTGHFKRFWVESDGLYLNNIVITDKTSRVGYISVLRAVSEGIWMDKRVFCF